MISKEQIKLFEKKVEKNKIIERNSVRNYFTRVLLNYDPSKISFINL